MSDNPTTRARDIGAVNWLGLRTLFEKEVRRFLKVFVQTLLAPVVQTVLFMAVLSLAWGAARGDVLGVSFTQFLGPGLVMMVILTNAFANSSSSLIVSKLQGNAVDFLMPPLSPAELTAGFVGGAVARGVLVGAASTLCIAFLAPFEMHSPLAVLYFAFSGSIMMGCVGLIAGIWADKFDHLSAVTSFVITPLTFLSGTFYSVTILPDAIEQTVHVNPFFHLIDGFRYGFIGASDGHVGMEAAAVAAINAALIAACYFLMRSGWRLKA